MVGTCKLAEKPQKSLFLEETLSRFVVYLGPLSCTACLTHSIHRDPYVCLFQHEFYESSRRLHFSAIVFVTLRNVISHTNFLNVMCNFRNAGTLTSTRRGLPVRARQVRRGAIPSQSSDRDGTQKRVITTKSYLLYLQVYKWV